MFNLHVCAKANSFSFILFFNLLFFLSFIKYRLSSSIKSRQKGMRIIKITRCNASLLTGLRNKSLDPDIVCRFRLQYTKHNSKFSTFQITRREFIEVEHSPFSTCGKVASVTFGCTPNICATGLNSAEHSPISYVYGKFFGPQDAFGRQNHLMKFHTDFQDNNSSFFVEKFQLGTPKTNV